MRKPARTYYVWKCEGCGDQNTRSSNAEPRRCTTCGSTGAQRYLGTQASLKKKEAKKIIGPRIIIVHSCADCPLHEYSDGQGHCGPFDKCKPFNIMLRDEDGPEDFDIKSGIHPKCGLAIIPGEMEKCKNFGNDGQFRCSTGEYCTATTPCLVLNRKT